MRPATFTDVTVVARVLRFAPASDREAICDEIFRRAEIADRYTRRTGKIHKDFGRGTLTDAATDFAQDHRFGFEDIAFNSCFQRVLKGVCTTPKSQFL